MLVFGSSYRDNVVPLNDAKFADIWYEKTSKWSDVHYSALRDLSKRYREQEEELMRLDEGNDGEENEKQSDALRQGLRLIKDKCGAELIGMIEDTENLLLRRVQRGNPIQIR